MMKESALWWKYVCAEFPGSYMGELVSTERVMLHYALGE